MVALRQKAFVCILHPCRRPSRLAEVILLVPLNMTAGHFQRRGREKTQRARRLLLVGNWVISPTCLGPAEGPMIFPSQASRKPLDGLCNQLRLGLLLLFGGCSF